MGVFFHLKNGDTKYAKIAHGSVQIDQFNDQIPRDDYSGYTLPVKKWDVRGVIEVWNNKEEVGEPSKSYLTTVHINSRSDDFPIGNLYEIVYDKYKETLYSYEDDI